MNENEWEIVGDDGRVKRIRQGEMVLYVVADTDGVPVGSHVTDLSRVVSCAEPNKVPLSRWRMVREAIGALLGWFEETHVDLSEEPEQGPVRTGLDEDFDDNPDEEYPGVNTPEE